MLIDCNVHLGRWPFRRLPIEDAEALLRTMDSAGVDRALVAPLESVFLRDGQQGNAGLRQMIAGREDRLTPVACLRPDAPGAADDLRRCREDWGFAGLKLHPTYHDCPLADPATEAVVGTAVDLGMFVSVSLRMEDSRFHTSTANVPDVPLEEAIRFVESWPQAQLVLCNAGRGEYPALAKSAAFQRGVVFVEHCELDGPYDPVRDLIDSVGAEHAVFGSHAALRAMQRAVVDFEAAEVDRETRRRMGEFNALRLLGESP